VAFANQPIATREQRLFEQIWQLPHVALRLGELSFNGWAVNSKVLDKAPGDSVVVRHEDLQPQISQKGVDMRIGMDIAALTLKKQVQTIVLVTGDSDLIPAMKFARREGAQLYLAPLRHKIKPGMYEHSDLILDFDLPPRASDTWMRPVGLVSVSGFIPTPYPIDTSNIKLGSTQGAPAAIWVEPQGSPHARASAPTGLPLHAGRHVPWTLG